MGQKWFQLQTFPRRLTLVAGVAMALILGLAALWHCSFSISDSEHPQAQAGATQPTAEAANGKPATPHATVPASQPLAALPLEKAAEQAIAAPESLEVPQTPRFTLVRPGGLVDSSKPIASSSVAILDGTLTGTGKPAEPKASAEGPSKTTSEGEDSKALDPDAVAAGLPPMPDLSLPDVPFRSPAEEAAENAKTAAVTQATAAKTATAKRKPDSPETDAAQAAEADVLNAAESAMLVAENAAATDAATRSAADAALAATVTAAELSETKLALESALEENEALKRQLAEVKETTRPLAESLAAANSEAELFRQEATELKLRMLALGVDGLSGDKAKLEQRLLKAVSDLRLLQSDKDKLSDELIQLSEAVLRYTKSATSPDADARMALEAQMRHAASALGIPGENGEAGEGGGLNAGGATGAIGTDAGGGIGADAGLPTSTAPGDGLFPQRSLTSGRVVSLKEELSLVVANIGKREGVQVGMPFKVVREGKIIAHVRVVDAREKIAGAVIVSLESEKNSIRVGDRLMVEAQ